VLLFIAVAAALVALAHTAPFPFALDAMHDDRVVWRMSADGTRPVIYLTYDDGPNPTATPALLDLLAREQVHATFFLIERHLTPETESIVRRIDAEGHAIGLHSHTRARMFDAPDALGRHLTAFSDRLTRITGHKPCRTFRPHAGARSSTMLEGLRRIDYKMVGWGYMLWDWDFFRARSVRMVPRLVRNASPGDIIVIHDGDHKDPRADRRYALEVTAALIPELRRRGFSFGIVCP
jgi:peptidoglycan/xylan/chitin deacetylase (PgdA/CDA1 family)